MSWREVREKAKRMLYRPIYVRIREESKRKEFCEVRKVEIKLVQAKAHNVFKPSFYESFKLSFN